MKTYTNDTRCILCRRRIDMQLRFMMPDEHMSWYCSNCGKDYKLVSSMTNLTQSDEGQVLCISIDNEESIKQIVFDALKVRWNLLYSGDAV